MGRKRKDGDPFGLAGTRLAYRHGKFWYRHRGKPERWEDIQYLISVALFALLTACGGGDPEDEDGSPGTVGGRLPPNSD